MIKTAKDQELATAFGDIYRSTFINTCEQRGRKFAHEQDLAHAMGAASLASAAIGEQQTQKAASAGIGTRVLQKIAGTQGADGAVELVAGILGR